MKAILIDPGNRSVSEVDVEGSLDSIYAAIGCELITGPVVLANRDILYLDDEALLMVPDTTAECLPGVGRCGFVFVDQREQVWTFIGKGLMMGTDHEGSATDVKSTVPEIHGRILQWLDQKEVIQYKQDLW